MYVNIYVKYGKKISRYKSDVSMQLRKLRKLRLKDNNKFSNPFQVILVVVEVFIKAGVHVKAVLTSLNMAFPPIFRSCFKQRQTSMLITITTVWRFCVNFWVVFGHFGKETFFLKG